MAGPHQLRRVGQSIAGTLDAMVDAAPRPGVDERLARVRAERAARAARAERSARSRGLRVACAFAAAAVAAGVAVQLARRASPRAVGFEVAGAAGRVGDWIAAGERNVPLAFSDGSRVEVRPSGRARVVTVDAHGANLLLERGSVHVDVVHRDGASWAIAAGPFQVHVIGTRFDASWDAMDELLTVDMSEGRVEVTGTCLGAPRAVVAGESVRLTCREIAAVDRERPAASAAPAEPGPAAASTPFDAPSGGGAASSAATPGWRELFKRADYPAALRAAELEGFDAIVARGSAPELLELADLARLAGRPEVARRTYVALRDRFAGAEHAATAAFHLGRMSFGAGGGEAERWFSIYLAERPSGPLAAEAMGRVLEIQTRSGRSDAARQTASRYLATFPNGVHAPLARSVVDP